MKKINKKLIGVIILSVILVGLCIVNFAAADTPQGTTGTALDISTLAPNIITPNANGANDKTICSDTGDHSDKSKWLPIIQCGNAGQHCCDVTEFFILINRIINWFLSISGSIAAITFSIAGIKILFNPSKPEQISEGWAMFRKTVIGMIIILCAWLVIHTVISALVAPYALRFLGN